VVNIVLAAAHIPLIREKFDKRLYDMIAGHMPSRHPGRVTRILAFVVVALTGASAVYGGVGLINSDSFVSRAFLEKTPFSSWVIPGILLLALVAVPMLTAAAMIARRRGDYALATVVAGAFLVAWIVGQLTVLDYGMVLQPALLLTGLVIIALGVFIHMRSDHRPWGLRTELDRLGALLHNRGTPGGFAGSAH
jgi:hypothetical protein